MSPLRMEGPLRGKKRKGSGYLEGRIDGALSLPEGGVREDLLVATQDRVGRRGEGRLKAKCWRWAQNEG